MRAFSGPLEPQEVEKPHAIEAACSRLATVAAIGLLEDLPGFVDDFRQRFRVRLRLPHANAGTLRQRQERVELPDALRDARAERVAPNQAIYDFARSEIARRRDL